MKEITIYYRSIMVGDAIGDDYNEDVFSVTRKQAIQTQDANRSHEINFNGFFLFVLLYLFLPTIIVLFFFGKWPFFILLAGAIFFLLMFKNSTWKSISCWSILLRNTWPLLILSATTVWLSGILPPFAENSDWYKHYALLNLLVDQSWPPLAITDNGIGVLRYSISYYVFPSVAGKLFGSTGISIGLYIWTTIGLFMAMVLAFGWNVRCLSALFNLGVMFLLFSGADLIGYYITKVMMGPLLHFEWWWAPFGELASIITNLFWTPQHALPSLLAAFLVLRYPYRSLQNAGIISAAVSVWSPFAAIGVTPIFLWTVYKFGFKALISYSNIVAAPILLTSAAMFLLEGSSNLPAQLIWNVPGFSINSWLAFIIVEFLAISLSLWIVAPKNISLISMSAIFLAILSIFRVGEYNDLLMRASIPALGILAVLSSFAVVYSKNTFRKAPLIICCIIGVVTPLGEIMRSLTSNHLPSPNKLTIQDAISHNPRLWHQYFVHKDESKFIKKKVLEFEDIKFYMTFGSATFDLITHRISSHTYTDAALVTNNILLPSGIYRIDATFDWDVDPMISGKNGGHLSLHGDKIIFKVYKSRSVNKVVTTYFQTNGEPFKLSFGLGGWSMGKGFIELKEMKVYKITY